MAASLSASNNSLDPTPAEIALSILDYLGEAIDDTSRNRKTILHFLKELAKIKGLKLDISERFMHMAQMYNDGVHVYSHQKWEIEFGKLEKQVKEICRSSGIDIE